MCSFRLATLVSALFACTLAVTAQTQTPPAPAKPAGQEEIYVLSPFVITAESETGWVATESLSGSRMKTSIKDLAQPIEVMTMDFLQDLGLNNFEQALVYSTNMEGPQNLTIDDGLGFGVFQPRNITRSRGLFGSTISRNFFESAMPTDNYNLDRITITRGPSSILFGLGSPAGIVDVSLQRANLQRRSVHTELQADSEESRRSSININQPLIKNRLAIRLAAVSEEVVTNSKPNLDRQDRYYGVVTYQPFKSTTISVHGEQVHRMSNRAPRVLPTDAYSLWRNAASVPGSVYTANQPLFDNRVTGVNPGNTTNATNVTVANAGTNSPIFNRQGNPGVMLFGAGSLDGNFQSWNNAVVVREPQNQLTAFNPLNSFDRFSFGNQNDIVPYDVNTFGTSRAQRLNSKLFDFFLEQKIMNNLFFEFAYNKEKFDERTADSGFSPNTINVDANIYLPDGVTSNPNVGRYYLQGRATGSEFWENREDWRATLSYEFDFAQKFQNRFLRWFGRHRLAALASHSENSRQGQQLQRGILDLAPSITGVTLPTGSYGSTTGTGTAQWATNGARDFHTRFYLGGAAGNSTYHPFGNLFGDWTFRDNAGNNMTAYLFDSPYRNSQGWDLIRTGSGPEGTLASASTKMLAWQGYFAKDRLVLLYGYREDEGKSAAIDPLYQVRDFSGLYPNARLAKFGPWKPSQTGITRTYGAVFHLLDWASVNYNQSDTFQLNIGKYDPYGVEYPGAVGEAKDIGIGLRLLDEKLILRASYFKNNGGPTRAGNNGFNDPLRDQIWWIEENIRVLDPSLPTVNVGSGGYRDKGRANYWVMFDAESKGYELDLSYRPSRNWSFILNGAKNTSVESKIGTEWIAYLNDRVPVWQSLNLNGVTWANAQPVLDVSSFSGKGLRQFYDENIVAQSLAFIQAVDGRGRDQGRKYRANFIADYNFTEGRLKGLGANIAVRYLSAPNLGYGVQTLPSGILAYDLNKAYKGTSQLFADFGVRYQGKIKSFGGMGYRVQLNVRNLLDNSDLEPVKVLTTGQYVSFSRVEPRIYQLTVSFDL